MTKRHKLDYDSDELTQNLQESAGKGVDALFAPQSPPPPEKEKRHKEQTQKPEAPATKREQSRKQESEQKPQPESTHGRTDETNARTAVLLQQVPPTPQQRRPERYAFQFWADQITRLKKLNQVLNLVKDPQDREEITLSDMVREAIDDYLDKQIEQLRGDERSDA